MISVKTSGDRHGGSNVRIAVTGHRGLPPETRRLVDQALRAELAQLDANQLVGISCLADGVDQLFARALLDAGGRLEVIIPAEQYRPGLPAESLAEYDALLDAAVEVVRLPWVESTPGSPHGRQPNHARSGRPPFAVWDGLPARGYGGTADVVHLARQQGVPVMIIWPRGAVRD